MPSMTVAMDLMRDSAVSNEDFGGNSENIWTRFSEYAAMLIGKDSLKKILRSSPLELPMYS